MAMKCFRIDVERVDECSIGHGWAVTRPGSGGDSCLVPFCGAK